MAKTKNAIHKNNIPATNTEVDVDFVLEHCGAEQVYVCGDFNQWHPTSLRLIGNPESGLWEKRISLPPGRYEYKFLVDGIWMNDPDARENAPNPYGSSNSVLEVRRANGAGHWLNGEKSVAKP